MIARPKLSENEWKTIEIGGFYKSCFALVPPQVRALAEDDLSSTAALSRQLRELRAFVVEGLRKRGIDVADRCYRRLAKRTKDEAWLDAAARREAGRDAGDSTSLQRGCVRSNARKERIFALRSLRKVIARPKLSQNEWKTTETRGF